VFFKFLFEGSAFLFCGGLLSFVVLVLVLVSVWTFLAVNDVPNMSAECFTFTF